MLTQRGHNQQSCPPALHKLLVSSFRIGNIVLTKRSFLERNDDPADDQLEGTVAYASHRDRSESQIMNAVPAVMTTAI